MEELKRAEQKLNKLARKDYKYKEAYNKILRLKRKNDKQIKEVNKLIDVLTSK